MVNQLKGSLYYTFINLRFSLIIFWGVLAGVLAISVVTQNLIADSYMPFNMSMPTYIFAAAFGYWMVKNTIPYLIKMGGTRTIIFLVMGIFGIVLSLFNALLANSISKLITMIYGNTGVGGVITFEVDGKKMTFNHIGDFLTNNTWFTRVIIDTSISFFLFGCLFICGLIFYKYGLVGGFGFLALGMISIILDASTGWLEEFVTTIFTNFNFTFFYQLFVVGLLIYLLSYLLLRQLTIR